MNVGAKGHKEDDRRLREFPAFDDFSDDELKRLVRVAQRIRGLRRGR